MHNARHADKNTCPLVVSGDAAHTADLKDLLLLVEDLGLLEHGGAVGEAIEGLGDLLCLGVLEYEKQGASAGVVLPREGTLAVRADHDSL